MAADRISGFTSDRARRRFLAAYQRAFDLLWPAGAERLDLPTGFGTARAYRSGRPDGVPIVLVPGAVGSALMWHGYVARLGRARPVIAIDPIGEPGASTQDRPIRDGRDAARCFEEVLAGLGLDRAHLLGSSYGGWIILQHELHHPGHAATVTLLDPAGFAPLNARFLAWIVASGLAGFAPRPVRRRAARWLHNATLLDDELMRLVAATIAFRRRLPPPPLLTDNELAGIAAPCLALFGARSLMHDSAEVAARLQARLPAGRAELIPGAGHDLPVCCPDLVQDRILEFVQAAEAKA